MNRMWLLFLVSLAGCGDDFAPASLIEEARVIGAKLSVVGAPERPVPVGGESVDVRWIVVSASNDDFTWIAAACEAQPSPVGRPVCAREPFFVGGSDIPTIEPPQFRLDVPAELDPNHEVLVLGVLCPDGTPNVTALESSRKLDTDTICSEGRGQIITQSIRSHVDAANTNPIWPPNPILIDGVPWTDGSCPEVMAGSTAEITLAPLPEQLRQVYTRMTNDVPPREVQLREVLLISHFMTHGELSRHFSADDGASEIRPIEWEVPDVLREQTVRFHIALRDQRGGADFIEREACVVPRRE